MLSYYFFFILTRGYVFIAQGEREKYQLPQLGIKPVNLGMCLDLE